MDENLVIHGGKKIIEKNGPHFIWPIIDKKTEEAVLAQLHKSISIYDRSGAIQELEDKLRKIHGVKHALLFSSGTSALHAMFVSADIKKGDEIICPAYTFYATVTPMLFTGAIPILVDCDKNGNINPEEIEKKITSKTRAIVLTHMWGIPCEMKKIIEIAKKHNLLLLEDGSHAHFAEYENKKVGTFGDAAAFSLQGQKTLTGGEGGFILTDNDELFYRALLFGHYNKRCKNEIPKEHKLSKFSTTGMGLKLRIHPLACAIAEDQLNKMPDILSGRQKTYERFLNELSNLPGIEFPELNPNTKPSWYALIIKYHSEELNGLNINDFYQALKSEGCLELDIPNSTSPLNYHPLFQTPSELFKDYNSEIKYKIGDFPKSEKFFSRILKLPVWHRPEDKEIVELYIKAFKKVINHYKVNMKFDEKIFEQIYSQSLEDGIEKPVVGAVIVNEKNEILLLKRPIDDFMGGINELPSGNMEKGEDIKSALLREVKEETNLEIEKIVRYLGFFDYLSGSGKKARQFNFLVTVKKGEIKLTEHDDYFWANESHPEYSKVTESVKKVLKKV